MGSTRAARHAGASAATAAVTINNATAIDKLTGSKALTPTSMLEISRVNARLSASPSAIP